ncbi:MULTISPECIES: hypothetical protein [Pseudomonas]|jgi:hypothetical protein|uniref:Uncharacterized protein n=2 Tax=Ectopseudomonas TaxID=3236654 RepID=A0A653B306_ECTOL|nr:MULTISPECIES: hypothetical protein [Pseudomonas]QTS86312.1 hypothetical protein JLK41_23890 [Pseudomonas khazarica]TNF19337.1 MAG: hypothetical protein EP327_01585 [Pseudomonadales bacterium]WFC64581.1 hypothetical protein EWH21_23580 [Pseudomonas sp. REST10]CAE6962837.1 conserved membrane protein of unknown function [Pseudomonas oleovorans]|tara:strand:+ start:85 stop:486 length:402 start_codon:yes stop_codon:yes gene_type:complete
MNVLQPNPMLRDALLLDGLLSGVTGLLLVLAAGWLGAFLELPRLLLLVAGSALLPFAALLVWLSNRQQISRQVVWAVIAVNALWVIDSLLVLLIGWLSPNLFGYAFVIAQALAVALLAELQWFGLRHSQAAAI